MQFQGLFPFSKKEPLFSTLRMEITDYSTFSCSCLNRIKIIPYMQYGKKTVSNIPWYLFCIESRLWINISHKRINFDSILYTIANFDPILADLEITLKINFMVTFWAIVIWRSSHLSESSRLYLMNSTTFRRS